MNDDGACNEVPTVEKEISPVPDNPTSWISEVLNAEERLTARSSRLAICTSHNYFAELESETAGMVRKTSLAKKNFPSIGTIII